MAPTSIPNLTPTGTTHDDPFGMFQVNGFYGPGAWAGWVMALISSWMAMRRDPTGPIKYDTLLHLLYTNWAAIDLMRQMNSDDPSFGPLAASMSVSYWGLSYCILPMLHYAWMENNNMFFVLFCSMVMPPFALFSFLPFARAVIGTSRAEFFQIVFPAASTRHGVRIVLLRWFLLGISEVSVVSFAAGITLVRMKIYESSKLGSRGNTSVSFLLGFLFVGLLTLSCICTLMFGMMFLVLHSSSRVNIPACFLLKPCTSQSIAEWDQAFALACGLVMFLYEVGLDIMKTVRRLVLQAGSWYMRRRGA